MTNGTDDSQGQYMKDGALLSVLNDYVSSSTEYKNTTLSDQIDKSYRYYYGEKLGNEITGKSSVVSKDVADAVDWIMPSLMRIFGGDTDVVTFIPSNEDEVEVAKQAHDYINYLYNVKNPGFENTYAVIQDSLLAKNGIMKHSFREYTEVEFDNYTGLDQESLEILLLEEGVELSATQFNDADGTYDVRVSKKIIKKRLDIEAIPPEEFVIDTWSSTIEDAKFVGHRRGITRSDLVAMGFDKDLVAGLNAHSPSNLSGSNRNTITRSRNSVDFSQESDWKTPEEASQEEVLVTEGVIKVDYDNDGIAESRLVLFTEDTILSNEEFDEPLFTDFRSHVIAHKFYGLSMYDQLKDIQRIKTTLMRNILDNMYTLNNGRYEVIDGQVNMDDLLHNQLGGVVRTKMAGALKRLDTPALPAQNFTMLDYLDKIKSDRSGVSDTTRGMDSNVLHSNQASTAVSQMMSAAEQKQELIARILGNSFSKLFSNIYKLTVLHQDKEEVFQTSGQFVRVNPAKWRKSLTVRPIAGLGNNRSAEKEMAAQRQLNLVNMVVGQGGMGILTDWKKIYNLITELTKQSGFYDSHNYWLNPDSPEAQQAIEELKQKQSQPTPEDIRAKSEAQKNTVDSQVKVEETKSAISNSMRELELREREVSAKERELDLSQEELDIKHKELELKQATVLAEVHLESRRNAGVAIGDGQVQDVTDGDLPQ